MAHDGEPTRDWKDEVSFERRPGSDAGSAWEDELARWETAAETPGETPVERPVETPLEPTAETPAETEGNPGLDHSWLTQPLEEVATPEVAAPEPEQPVSLPPPLPSPDPAPATVLPLPAPEPVPESSPWPAPPSPPGLLPDLPAAQAEPETDTWPGTETETEAETFAGADASPEPVAAEGESAPHVPFYKRELSLKRTKGKPKRKREPKQRRERTPRRAPKPKPEPKPETVAADAPAKVPFYRRELSFGRSRTDWEPAERPEAPPKARRPRPSLPKLELPSLDRSRGGSASKRIVGLKIGASQLAAARVVNNGSPELVQAVRAPLEPGVVVAGELRDPEALAQALKEFFKRHRLPTRGIRLGIANNRIGVRVLDVVGIEDPRQLDNAIKFRAQEVLPIPIEEAVLDYQVLSDGVDAEGKPSRRVLLVVAYRELVDRYVSACRKAGLQIVGIDLEAFALLRALAAPRPVSASPDHGALVAVAVGHDRSTFAVSDGRVCEFTRVLQWGGWSLNVAIARALDTAPSEAEAVKRALSFAGGADAGPEELPPGFGRDQLETAREVARRELQTFARELVSSLQFYQGQPDSLSIGEIVVTGGTAHLPGLAAELERLVGVPVRVGDPLARVKVAKKVKETDQLGSLAVAIGLGIED